MVFIFKFTDS